jgi:S1-C subfamily serine protease
VTVLGYDEQHQPMTLGTGFVVARGSVVTNAHVIAGATHLLVRPIGDASTHVVTTLLQLDEATDLALLEVGDLDLAPLALSDDAPAIGDTVYAVGSPLGLEGTFSQGIVSGYRTYEDAALMQITAPVSPGSSGGPVLDVAGTVVGVAVGTFTGGQSLNFAIPSGVLARFVATPAARRPVDAAVAVKPVPGIGGDRLVDSVQGSALLFGLVSGSYSFSVRNHLARPIRDVDLLIVFYDHAGLPLETDAIRVRRVVLPGLATRVESRVHRSVHEIVTGATYRAEPSTRIEIRVLGFEFAD